MEYLPEDLYVDRTSSSSLTAGAESAAVQRAKIQQIIDLLRQPERREEALTLLNKERKCKEMPLLLWNSKGTSFILLQEILAAYKFLSPPVLGVKEATRVCNALALLQAIASHPDTRMEIIRARMPVYIYPFMNTTEQGLPHKHFDNLRLTSLGVIGALVKVEDVNTPEIIHFLLETEVFPLCMRCMDVGGDLAKTLGVFIVSKILMYEEGQRYCGTFPERFYAVANILSKVVDSFSGKPPKMLLRHILTCFMCLYEVSRASYALSKCYPARLRDPTYLNFACEDLAVSKLAYELLHIVTVCA